MDVFTDRFNNLIYDTISVYYDRIQIHKHERHLDRVRVGKASACAYGRLEPTQKRLVEKRATKAVKLYTIGT